MIVMEKISNMLLNVVKANLYLQRYKITREF